MGNWILRWNFNKSVFTPGEQPLVSFWIENTSDTALYLSNLTLVFDFGSYDLETISGAIQPRENKYLGNISLLLPPNVVGKKVFTITYVIQEYINNVWVNLGSKQVDGQYFISIYPQPLYKIFVSRGLSVEDRAIGDTIAEMIREWGFQTITVGVEVQVPDNQVATQVRNEIRQANGVIIVATPRFIDSLTGLWKTFEWCHDELGIAFGIDKPLLILKDKRVTLGGLPSYLQPSSCPLLEFNPYNLAELKANFSTIMPGFREWVENKRNRDFFEALGKFAIGTLAVVGLTKIISGIIGSISGTSKK